MAQQQTQQQVQHYPQYPASAAAAAAVVDAAAAAAAAVCARAAAASGEAARPPKQLEWWRCDGPSSRVSAALCTQLSNCNFSSSSCSIWCFCHACSAPSECAAAGPTTTQCAGVQHCSQPLCNTASSVNSFCPISQMATWCSQPCCHTNKPAGPVCRGCGRAPSRAVTRWCCSGECVFSWRCSSRQAEPYGPTAA